MISFTIWTPHINQKNKKSVDMTIINSEILSGIGSDLGFAQNILRDINVKSNAVRWNFNPYRSYYYTDYPQKWYGRWQIVWIVSIEIEDLAEDVIDGDFSTIYPTSTLLYKFTEQPNENEPVSCLLVSDFNDDKNIQNVIEFISKDNNSKLFQDKYALKSPNWNKFSIDKNLIQLQIDIGVLDSYFYENGADYAEYILDVCRRFGGTCHYQERDIFW